MSSEPGSGTSASGSGRLSLRHRLSRAVRAFRGGAEGEGEPAGGGRAIDRPTGTGASASALIARMSRSHLSGRLAERATHEISNHLQLVLGNAELLAMIDALPDRARAQLARITEAGRNAAAVNAALRALSRGDDASFASGDSGRAPISLGEGLGRLAAQLDWVAGPARFDASAITGDTRAIVPAASVTPALLGELLLRLVWHARASAVSGDVIALRADRTEEGGLRLSAGIEAELAPAPSARTAPAPGGTDERVSLGVLAALAELAGGRFGAGEPDELLLPVEPG